VRSLVACGGVALAIAVTGSPGRLAAQAEPVRGEQTVAREPADSAYFYSGLPGSDQYVGPLDVVVSFAYNFSQAQNRDRRIFQATYGARHAWNSIVHPIESIEGSGGWGDFFTRQILPIQAVTWIKSGFRWEAADNMAWYPNYFGHFVELGISSRRLTEKLRAQGIPRAALIAGTTTMIGGVLTEMYTHPGFEEGTGATVADIYVFDLGGVLAFTLDPVARFFSRTLHATVWPSQAAITLPDLELANNANNVVLNIPLPFQDRASLFIRTAVGAHLGVTVHLDRGYDLSLGVGQDATHQLNDPITQRELVAVDLSASIYLDRGGSLLASAYWSQNDHRLLSLNVYPGVWSDDFGAWLTVLQRGGVQLGLTHRHAMGLGAGWAF
jgi:hypothetical protein